MPQPSKPSFPDTLIRLSDRQDLLLRVKCCGVRHYRIDEVMKVVGDIRLVDVGRYFRCEKCGASAPDWKVAYLTAQERQTIRIRRLVEIRTIKRAIWRDE